MLNYARFRYFLKNHQYAEAVAEARHLQSIDKFDMGPVDCLAESLLALGDFTCALPLFGQVDSAQRSDTTVPGQSGRRIWMSCINWILGNKGESIKLMSEMTDGIVDGSIKFGDAAGGVQQGILLYYMGVSISDQMTTSRALDYLRTRVKRPAIELFPGPVARYYLGEINFNDLLAAATKGRAGDVVGAIEVAKTDLLTRRWLSVALFHDGAKGRAQGDEMYCHMRMRECFSLENPLLEPEWYLARHEVGTRRVE